MLRTITNLCLKRSDVTLDIKATRPSRPHLKPESRRRTYLYFAHVSSSVAVIPALAATMGTESKFGYKFAPLTGWVTAGSTVFVLFTLEGSSTPEPPSTHPEDFLTAQLRRGNLAQMWLQTKEKLQGLKVGSGPSFAWPQDLLLPGICLFSSSSVLSLMISCKFPSRGSFYFLLLNSCF